MNFDLDKLIKSYGTVTGMAKAFGVSRTTIYQWKEKGVPQYILASYQLGMVSAVLSADEPSDILVPLDGIDKIVTASTSDYPVKQVANGIDIDALKSALKPLVDELVNEKLNNG